MSTLLNFLAEARLPARPVRRRKQRAEEFGTEEPNVTRAEVGAAACEGALIS